MTRPRDLHGRNRLRACQIAGIEPVFEMYVGADPLGFVVSENLHRRHLTDGQRSMAAAEVATMRAGRPWEKITSPDGEVKQAGETKGREQAAREFHVGTSSLDRARQVLKKGAPAGNRNARKLNASRDAFNSTPAKDSRKAMAERARVGEATLDRARRIVKNGTPELVKAVVDGELKVNTVYQVADLPKEEQKALVEAGPEAVKKKAAELRTELKPPTEPAAEYAAPEEGRQSGKKREYSPSKTAKHKLRSMHLTNEFVSVIPTLHKRLKFGRLELRKNSPLIIEII